MPCPGEELSLICGVVRTLRPELDERVRDVRECVTVDRGY